MIIQERLKELLTYHEDSGLFTRNINRGKYLKDSHLDRILNGKGVMPAWKAVLNDTDIAAVIVYERNGLGNSVGDVLQPSQVKAARQ